MFDDVRYAFRRLTSKPLTTLVAVLTLALGIGATTALYCAVLHLVLKPLPYAEPDKLVAIYETRGRKILSSAYPNYLDWKGQNNSFASMAGYWALATSLKIGPNAVRTNGAYVESSLFAMLGEKPILGRVFSAREDKVGASLAVISHRSWIEKFGGSGNILGKTIYLGSGSYTVIGVMPSGFEFLNSGEFWLPLGVLLNSLRSAPGVENPHDRNNHLELQVFARLSHSTNIAGAQADMEVLAARLAKQYPRSNAGHGIQVKSLKKELLLNLDPTLWMLFAAVVCVLVVACLNVGSLQLALVTARKKELAVRMALGASKARLLQQLMVENILLGICGGLAGILVAVTGLGLLKTALPSGTYRLAELAIDAPVLAFCLAVSAVSGLLCGLLPSAAATEQGILHALKDDPQMVDRRSGGTIRVLIAAEVAIALVLVAGAGLLTAGVYRLQSAPVGYSDRNVLTYQTSLNLARYSQPSTRLAFTDRVLQEASVMPGVQNSALTTALPLSGYQSRAQILAIEGRPAHKAFEVDYASVSPDFFATLGIPLYAGRIFERRDDPKSRQVVLMSDTLARKCFPDKDPVGQRVQLDVAEGWLTVVGTVGSIKQNSLTEERGMQIYRPYAQDLWPDIVFVFKTVPQPESLKLPIERLVLGMEPQLTGSSATQEEVAQKSLGQRRILWIVLVVFAGLSVALAAVGIYGMLAYTSSLRKQEIGVRMALGATRQNILLMMLWQGMWPVLIGVGIGTAATLILSRLASSAMYNLSAIDPVVLVVVVTLILTVAVIACMAPAIEASRTEPMQAIRGELK
ncbi:ABC transporter permease [Gloeobacter morelensis]|uniref:ABC transporter permease n=1 Tax=Gloeobacter morelensis TaxID=2907343 RepID=UPI001E511E2F|nr:ABC transporter permease [Gloeobacter morelensis]UFP97206.1 ABC transporter permease [Gloeobacter morelensis MG652769]